MKPSMPLARIMTGAPVVARTTTGGRDAYVTVDRLSVALAEIGREFANVRADIAERDAAIAALAGKIDTLGGELRGEIGHGGRPLNCPSGQRDHPGGAESIVACQEWHLVHDAGRSDQLVCGIAAKVQARRRACDGQVDRPHV